jgi:Holliday junction resolvase RusA-like endonuclease
MTRHVHEALPWPTRIADLGFTVLGTPQQQGSKNYRIAKNGAVYGYDANRAKLMPWRANAIYSAQEAAKRDHVEPFTGGVLVQAASFFKRPANHYGTGRNAGQLKPNAPIYKASKPDADKLGRAIGDALSQSGVIRDDAKIVDWRLPKFWGDNDRVEISIWAADIEQLDRQVVAGTYDARAEQPALLS